MNMGDVIHIVALASGQRAYKLYKKDECTQF